MNSVSVEDLKNNLKPEEVSNEGKTKGELYKEKHGISRTMARNVKRNMTKNGFDPAQMSEADINAYRAERKKRKKAEKLLQQKNHQTKKLNRESKIKSNNSKK